MAMPPSKTCPNVDDGDVALVAVIFCGVRLFCTNIQHIEYNIDA